MCLTLRWTIAVQRGCSFTSASGFASWSSLVGPTIHRPPSIGTRIQHQFKTPQLSLRHIDQKQEPKLQTWNQQIKKTGPYGRSCSFHMDPCASSMFACLRDRPPNMKPARLKTAKEPALPLYRNLLLPFGSIPGSMRESDFA